MCGYKNRKSPYMEFLYISFSKGKEFNNEFDDLHSDAWLFFDIICTRTVSMEKSKGRQNCGFIKKLFLYKASELF